MDVQAKAKGRGCRLNADVTVKFACKRPKLKIFVHKGEGRVRLFKKILGTTLSPVLIDHNEQKL